MKQIIRRVALWIMCISVVALSLTACAYHFELEAELNGHWEKSMNGATGEESKVCVAGGHECKVGSIKATGDGSFSGKEN